MKDIFHRCQPTLRYSNLRQMSVVKPTSGTDGYGNISNHHSLKCHASYHTYVLCYMCIVPCMIRPSKFTTARAPGSSFHMKENQYRTSPCSLTFSTPSATPVNALCFRHRPLQSYPFCCTDLNVPKINFVVACYLENRIMTIPSRKHCSIVYTNSKMRGYLSGRALVTDGLKDEFFPLCAPPVSEWLKCDVLSCRRTRAFEIIECELGSDRANADHC